jgi:CRP/FNR family transcriptional regulator, anaerobic regulatory protein
LKIMTETFQLVTIKKGAYFLKQGKKCNKLGFIQSGFLRISASAEEKDITQWISTKGYFVTDLSSFIFENPARWTIQALTDTQIFCSTKESYNKAGEQIKNWQTLEKLFLTRCFVAMEERIFTLLSMTSEERYDSFFENNKELFNQIPLQYIASMLGMTPETFSRIRRRKNF